MAPAPRTMMRIGLSFYSGIPLEVKAQREIDLPRIRDARRLQEVLRRHHAAEAGVIVAVEEVLRRHADGDPLLTSSTAAWAATAGPGPAAGTGAAAIGSARTADGNHVGHVGGNRRSPWQASAVPRQAQRTVVENRVAILVDAGGDRIG